MKLLVAFGGFDRIHQLLGFDEVLVVSVQVVGLGDVAADGGQFPVDAIRPVLLQVRIR